MRRFCVFLGALAAALALSVPPQSVALQGLPRPRLAEPVAALDRDVDASQPVIVRSSRGSARGRVLLPPEPRPLRRDTSRTGVDTVEANQAPQQSIAVTVQVLNLDQASYRFAVHQNYPNPIATGSRTVIQYSVGRATRFTIAVYSITGQRIRTLVDRDHEPGNYSVTWDLVDNAGHPVPPGIYFYRGAGGWYIESRRLIVR